MDKINMSELGDMSNYLILITPDDVDVGTLDRILNESGIITGLLGGYEYLCKEDNFISILLKMDEDTIIHRDMLNSKVGERMYVCDYSNYANLKKHIVTEPSESFNLSEASYGYNDMKVLMNRVGDDVIILIMAPFLANGRVIKRITGAFMGMYSALYGQIPEEYELPDGLDSLMGKFKVSYSSLTKYKRFNFDMIMNYLLSILNIDKYSTLEALAISDNIKSLLEE